MTTLSAPAYDVSPPLSAEPAAGRKPLWRILFGGFFFAAFFVGYAALLLSRFAPAITQPDDNGYFAQASLIVREHSTWYHMASPAQYVGMHWLLVPGDDHKFVPRYPAGLPALIAVPYALFGWKAAVLTNPVLALGCLLAVFLLTKRITGRTTWGLTAAAVLGINPPFVEHALSGDSHIGVACFLAWSMYLLWMWHETRRGWVAVLAGVAIGAIPTIRYADCVMYLGLGLFVLWSLIPDWRGWLAFLVPGLLAAVPVGGLFVRDSAVNAATFSELAAAALAIALAWTAFRNWRLGRPFSVPIALMVAGALIPTVPLLIRNHYVLGHFWKTGYDLTNEQTGFSKEWFRQHYSLYLDSLLSNGMGVFYGVGILGIVGLIGARKYRGVGLAAAFSVVPMVLLYMAYYWAGMGGNAAGIMRFMVPVFVPLTIGAAWAVGEVGNKLSLPARVAIPVVLLALQGYWGIPEMNAQIDRQKYNRDNLTAVTAGMEGTVEPGAVVIADNGLLQHLDFVREWKVADAGNYRGNGQGFRGMFRSEDQPSPQQPAKSKYMATLYHGTVDERKTAFFNDCQTWAAGKKVYFVGTESDATNLGRLGAELKIVKRIPLPGGNEPAQDGPPGGGPGGFGPPGGPGGGPPGMGGPPDGGGMGRFFGGGGGGGRANGRGFGGQGGGGGRRFGGGGGMMNAGSFGGASEIVIAEWRSPNANVQPVSSK